MAVQNRIQIYRSEETDAPTSLANGELAWSSNGDVLFVGDFGSVLAVAGRRAPGTLTANQAIVVNSTSFVDEVKVGNLTVKTVTIQNINAVANSTVLGSASNTELTTTWAIKQYVDLNAGGGGASELDELSDVTLTTPANNDLLVYDADDAQWENHTLSGTANEVEISRSGHNITIGLPDSVVITTALSVAGNGIKANNGITMTADGMFADGANGISVTAAGINVAAANGLLANTTALYVVPGTGVVSNSTGVHIGQAVGTTDNVTFNDLIVSGNLTVNGDTVTVDAATLAVEDPLIILAKNNNATDTVDIGFYGLYDTSGSQDLYAGFFRDASDGKFKLFVGNQAAPTTTVNVGGTGYTIAQLVAHLEDSNVAITGGSITGITDLLVADGGTGRSSLTDNAVLVGDGTNAVELVTGSNYQVLQLSGAGAVVFSGLDGGTF